MEFVVEKSVELNIEAVHFIVTKRSVVKEIPESKWKRLIRVTEASAKQCGRSHPLLLLKPIGVDELIERLAKKMSHFIFLEKGERKTVRNLLKQYDVGPPYGLWIGPEGGWDAIEIEWASRHGFLPSELGPLVLRSETAAVHAVSTILALAF